MKLKFNHRVCKEEYINGEHIIHLEIYGKNKVLKGVAVLDASEYERMKEMSFSISSTGYVRVRQIGYNPQYLHRFIMNPPKHLTIDHINGNRTDNRKSNLRICTQKNNMKNIGKLTGNYKGVYESESSWIAQIALSEGGQKHIGSFETEEEAALAYNEVAVKEHGVYARLNVVNTPKSQWVKKIRRRNKGESIPNSKLTDEKVCEIRKLYNDKKFDVPSLAGMYGVSKTTMRQAIKGETWKHLPILDGKDENCRLIGGKS